MYIYKSDFSHSQANAGPITLCRAFLSEKVPVIECDVGKSEIILRGVIMTVLFIILGIMFVAGGISCIFTPLVTFMEYGYFVVILMTVFGILDIVKSIAEKRFGVNFAFGILSVVLGVVMVAFPANFIIAQSVMLIMTAVWFVLRGVISIITSLSVTKSTGSRIWILQLILGILDIIVGGVSFAHPMILALSFGVLIGIFFIETGFTLMSGGIIARDGE